MASKSDKYTSRRAQTTFVSTIIGMSLVLFLLGIVTITTLGARKLANEVKENLTMEVWLKEDAKDVEIREMEKQLKMEDWVKSAHYISKDSALHIMQETMGNEDVLGPLDDNPFKANILIYLKADYSNIDSVDMLAERINIQFSDRIYEVFYDKKAFTNINQDFYKWMYAVLGFCGLLLLIAVALINNTIRLAIYSKRFVIRTMMLVGASRRFIRRPYLWGAVLQGITAGILAMGMILGILFVAREYYPGVMEFFDVWRFFMVYAGLSVIGVIVAWLATFLALEKYIKLNPDKLY